MPRIIFCIAILTLLVILLAKLGHRIYWRIRNRMNHCKGRVVKRMCDKALERTFAELANDNDEQIIVEREYKPRR